VTKARNLEKLKIVKSLIGNRRGGLEGSKIFSLLISRFSVFKIPKEIDVTQRRIAFDAGSAILWVA
jgi:hypothetical protein